jgi:N-acetylmuramoyl-L-alanine amidase
VKATDYVGQASRRYQTWRFSDSRLPTEVYGVPAAAHSNPAKTKLRFSRLISEIASTILALVMRGWFVAQAVLFFAGAIQVNAFEWTLIKQGGRDYIPFTDVARFYNFTQANFSNERVSLSGATLRIQGGSNSRELYMNGLKFILNFPVIQEGSMLYISRMDLAKLVEPVLRPAKIQTAPVRTVILDAGHGGFDQGARSALGNEKDFALDVILRARELFSRSGFTVRLTRSADVFIPLETRAMFASHQSNALFVSVHFNYGSRADAEGIETYCLAPRGVPSTNDPTLTLADFQPCLGNVRDPENIALASAMHASLITRLGVPDRGIKRARFVVLKNDGNPGVLIEGGFLSSPRDVARIAAPAYRQMMAQAIFQGVLAYNRAVERSTPGATAQVAEKDHVPVGSGDSVWDPLKSNVYSLPQEIHR